MSARHRVDVTFRHVGLLSIQGSQFQIAEIPLKTVRPFELDEVILTEAVDEEGSGVNLEDKDTITAYLRRKVSLYNVCMCDEADGNRWRA